MRRFAAILVAIVSMSVLAATPSAGVPVQVRRGLFTEAGFGGMFTLGGLNAFSNFQTYVQLGLGYQLTLNEGRGIVPIGLHVGIGTNAQNCWSQLTASGACTQADSFTMNMINLTGGYLHQVIERLYLGGKLIGGVSVVDPDPIGDGALVRPVIGGALSLEYATQMDHFSAGLDVAYRLIFGPNINALSFAVRVQYTF